MWPVKDGLDTVQQQPDTGTAPLESLSAICHKHGLNVVPDYAGLHWVLKDGFKRFAVLTGNRYLKTTDSDYGTSGYPLLSFTLADAAPGGCF